MLRLDRTCVSIVLASCLVPAACASSGSALAATQAGDAPQVVNLLPVSGSGGVPARANLCVEASDPGGESLTLTFYGRDLSAAPAEDFTLIALPDTQIYAQSYPAIFNSQTAWIVDQREALRIAFVTQLGDIVDAGQSEFEWNNADAAFSLLEDPGTTGLVDGIPYGLVVASHDQANRGHGTLGDPAWTTPLFNQHFGPERFEGRAYFGGSLGNNNDNSYQLFSASGMDFVILHLEGEEDTAAVDPALHDLVLDWADAVLKTHSDRRAIVSSHFLLNPADESWTLQGQAIYDRLKHNPNLFLMLCAHFAGEPRRSDTFQGNTVHTLMSDYQFYENGGNGYLRVYTFSPAADEIRTTTYSPWLDGYRVNPQDQFTLGYAMSGGRPFEIIGMVVDAPSGNATCLEWTGRKAGAEFEWYVEASNSDTTSRGAVASFFGDGSCQTAAHCDDHDPCTASTCLSQSQGCAQLPLPNCCEEDPDCDDDNPCTDDVCAQHLCSNTPNTRPCSDGSPCSGGDTCSGGVCLAVTDNCDDGNACTQDTCFEDACFHEYLPAGGCCQADIACHDGDPCTFDTCGAGGSCANVVDTECCAGAGQCDNGDGCSTHTCAAANRAAFRVNGSEHVSMRAPGYWPVQVTAAAAVFTLELWFKWDGGRDVTLTSEPNKGGLSAYPLLTRGRHDLRDLGTQERNVNYFLGILEDTHVLVGDFEEHDTGSNPGFNHPVTGSTVIGVDSWHHAALSYDGNCWQLYLDGQPETDGTNCPGEPPDYASISGLNIGSAQDFQGWIEGHFSGLLDEVRVWNRALSAAEIQANMNLQIEDHPDLIGRWGLDEVEEGLFVYDSTGNGHTGIAVGGTLETIDVLPLGGTVCVYNPVAPAPVGVLRMVRRPESVDLSWPHHGPGNVYDVVRGDLAALRSGGANPQAVCLADDLGTTQYADTTDLPSGDGVFYLVRAVNNCGVGPFGTSSSGQPRQPQNACP